MFIEIFHYFYVGGSVGHQQGGILPGILKSRMTRSSGLKVFQLILYPVYGALDTFMISEKPKC